jgi:serine/threonine protein kinase
MPLSPGTSLGRYKIHSQIGAGGMGEVYLAYDPRLNRKVALKVLPANLINNRERLLRFEQEAQVASALNHPNILTIHEIGVEGETHFIATEYIEGETLRRRLQTTRLEIKETLSIATQIVAALDAAHRSGIVHRDIKPENVMVRADGLVKVLDFGLATKCMGLGNCRTRIRASHRLEPPTGAAKNLYTRGHRGITLYQPRQAFSLRLNIKT